MAISDDIRVTSGGELEWTGAAEATLTVAEFTQALWAGRYPAQKHLFACNWRDAFERPYPEVPMYVTSWACRFWPRFPSLSKRIRDKARWVKKCRAMRQELISV